MQSAVILEKEVSDLHAENEKKKQKRKRSTRQIQHEEGLTVTEAQELCEAPIEVPITLEPPKASSILPPLQPHTKASPKCSLCGIQGHRITTCPDRPR